VTNLTSLRVITKFLKLVWNLIFICSLVLLIFNLVNKTNLMHNLFLVYLSISTCFGRLRTHHQEKQLCLCDTWHLLFSVDDCLVCRVEFIPPCITSVAKHSSFSWWCAHSRPKHVEIDKCAKNKLCTKLVLFTRLCRDA